MPIGPTKTKAQKRNVVHQEMRKFKEGTLHSGSKSGPLVTNRKQAIAIALSESGQSKKRAMGGAIGSAIRFAGGGEVSVKSYVRHSPAGFVHSSVPGRTDKIPATVGGGSYVLPADVVSGVGQNNSLAGAEALDKLLGQRPYGGKQPHFQTPKVNYGGHLQKMPSPRSLPGMPRGAMAPQMPKPQPGSQMTARTIRQQFADGGPADFDERFGDWRERVVAPTADTGNKSTVASWPAGRYYDLKYMQRRAKQRPTDMHYAQGGRDGTDVIVSGGEFIVAPETVRALGHGDIKRGFAILDAFVHHVRKQNVHTLRKLPGPKK